MKILDCTLRDGGYYNSWDFPQEIVSSYIEAMVSAGVDILEIGLRSLKNNGFKGASAFTKDSYLESLNIPDCIEVAVMVNASELTGIDIDAKILRITELFPLDAKDSRVDIIRIACHVHEFIEALELTELLKEKGYKVGFNLMQIADRSDTEITALAKAASEFPIDVLYFADSMGSMNPERTSSIVSLLRMHWSGDLGIHTHDNMGLALSNSLCAVQQGVTWIDATVTGMGRGPGNARTEELLIESAQIRNTDLNIVSLMSLISSYFQPMKNRCGWGSNPYYFLSGKYGIHPTYIQEMLSDSRYSDEDVFSAIEYLKLGSGKKFSFDSLKSAKNFYIGSTEGSWSPKSKFNNKRVLLLGTGPGVADHSAALEKFIHSNDVIVLALNTQSAIRQDLIDYRVACHPVRLLADCKELVSLPQALITPFNSLPPDVRELFKDKSVLDFGINVQSKTFWYGDYSATVPIALVVAYALAICASGNAEEIYMAGFDGYSADDPRNHEMNTIIQQFINHDESPKLTSITPTKYEVPTISVYGMVD